MLPRLLDVLVLPELLLELPALFRLELLLLLLLDEVLVGLLFLFVVVRVPLGLTLLVVVRLLPLVLTLLLVVLVASPLLNEPFAEGLVASPLPVEAPVALPLRVVLLVFLVASYALRTSKALALRSAFAARSKAEFCTATLAFLTLNDCSGCLLP